MTTCFFDCIKNILWSFPVSISSYFGARPPGALMIPPAPLTGQESLGKFFNLSLSPIFLTHLIGKETYVAGLLWIADKIAQCKYPATCLEHSKPSTVVSSLWPAPSHRRALSVCASGPQVMGEYSGGRWESAAERIGHLHTGPGLLTVLLTNFVPKLTGKKKQN